MSDKYQKVIEDLFERVPMFQDIGAGAYKPGLEGVTMLADAFGNPHKKFKSIHVGGTNGKGSVSSLLASVLQENGLKVGLFTSPHLVDFRERIRVNGQMIPEEKVVDFIERFDKKNLEYSPSFFELTTIMAFDHFAKEKVDIAVIEVGLGGRLDSTNIIKPILSVITNISLDHTAQLGDTVEQIAREKAGIIKHASPVIVGEAQGSIRKVFSEKAHTEKTSITFACDNVHFKEVKNRDNFNFYAGTPWGELSCPLTGDCQQENAATVLTALDNLKSLIHLSQVAVQKGFKNVFQNTGLQGRWMIFGKNPFRVCDTGHNPGGWKWLGPRLKSMADKGKLHIVAGFVNDKDISHILSEMPRNAAYYWATPSVKRGKDAFELCQIAEREGIKGKAFNDVASAFEAAMNCASESDSIFVGGSTFIVADLLSSLKTVS